MKATQIKVDCVYTAELDAVGERAEVTIVRKYRKSYTRMSGKGGMPSVWTIEKTVYDVIDRQGRISTGVEARHIFPHNTQSPADAADSAGFAFAGGVTEAELAAELANAERWYGVGEPSDSF